MSYTFNLLDPVVFSDERWEQLCAALADANEFLRSQAFSAAGNCIRKALDLLDESRMQRTDGFVPQGTVVGQATLRRLESRLEHALALAFQDVDVALDNLISINAMLNDLYFEQNDPAARTRCRDHARHIYRELPVFLAAVEQALPVQEAEAMFAALRPCVEKLLAVQSAVSEYQHTTVADDLALVEQWGEWMNFALTRLVLGQLDGVQFALREIRQSAARQLQRVFDE